MKKEQFSSQDTAAEKNEKIALLQKEIAQLEETKLVGSDEKGWHCFGCDAYNNPDSGMCQCNGNEVAGQIRDKKDELNELLNEGGV